MPASQLAHVPWPVSGCTVPALHGVWLSAPVLQREPSGQTVHWSLLPSPGVLLNVPSLHGRGALLPSSQYEPAVHSKHAVWPLTFMNLPASHLSQLPRAASGCTVPGLQGVASHDPAGQKEPTGHAWQSSLLVMGAATSGASWERRRPKLPLKYGGGGGGAGLQCQRWLRRRPPMLLPY